MGLVARRVVEFHRTTVAVVLGLQEDAADFLGLLVGVGDIDGDQQYTLSRLPTRTTKTHKTLS